MASIKKCVEFDESHISLIRGKLENILFSHKNWSDPDLKDIRSFIRKFYRLEQKGICPYCRNSVSLYSASNCQIEHIAPKAIHRSFMFEPRNLCVICADCNEIKKAQETCNEAIETINNPDNRKKYPRSSGAFKIVHPHFDTYEEHILKLPGNFYADLTEKGHFTIGTCKLNRKLRLFGREQVIIDDDMLTELMEKWSKEKDPARRKEMLKEIKLLLRAS